MDGLWFERLDERVLFGVEYSGWRKSWGDRLTHETFLLGSSGLQAEILYAPSP
jgi:hypothetical protein